MHKTIVATASALLTTAGVCLAQSLGTVSGTTAQEGASRRQETAGDVRAAIDWAGNENARTGSPLKGRIAQDAEFANVASNRLRWTFKGDKKAGAMFTGKNCSLRTNSNWDVRSKGIKE
jgi:hypothetical protein